MVFLWNDLCGSGLSDRTSGADIASPAVSALKDPARPARGFSLEIDMDRDDGFPPHIIGFMKRKREKEKLQPARPFRLIVADDDHSRTAPNA